MKEIESESALDHAKGEPGLSRFRRARKWAYDFVQSEEIETRAERYVRFGITLLILLNVAAVMIETIEDVHLQYPSFFYWLEAISVGIFTVEYLLRVWSAVEEPRYARPIVGRLRYAFSFFALIDLLAILPFYLPMLVKIDLRTLRILRLLRLARLLKLGRYSRAARILIAILRNQREQLIMSTVVLLFLLVCASTLIYYLEHEAQPEAFSSIPTSLWWGIITLTTIGYGDTYPVTIAGKVCAALISILSIGMVALPSGIIVSGFVHELEQEREADRKQGIIRCPHCGEEIGTTHNNEHQQNTTV